MDCTFTFVFPCGDDGYGNNFDHCDWGLNKPDFMTLPEETKYDPKWLAADMIPVICEGEVIYEESIFRRAKQEYK